MITESELYWILKLDDIKGMLCGLVVFGVVVFVVISVAWCVNRSDDRDWKPENALFYKKACSGYFGLEL